jgi:type I restriction enzyme M protein
MPPAHKHGGEHGPSVDILGRAYEYCLGKLAGEFYTPACVVKTLVEVIKPFDGRVYDPCYGSGGMFVQSAQFIEHHGGARNPRGNINNLSVFGQDSNPTTWKIYRMNLAIRGIEADLGEAVADTFFNDLHKTEKMDFILANPLFNLSD